MSSRWVRSLLATPLYVLLAIIGYGVRAAMVAHRWVFYLLLWVYPEMLFELREKIIARYGIK